MTKTVLYSVEKCVFIVDIDVFLMYFLTDAPQTFCTFIT